MAQELLVRLRQIADQVANLSLHLFFPPLCAGCGRLGEILCPQCAQEVEPVPLPQCTRCGRPQPKATMRCADCARHPQDPLTLTRAAALHLHPLRQAIHELKYQARPELAPLLARYLSAVYALEPWCSLPEPITAVVPIPLHSQRKEERGYNQAELLAENFSNFQHLPMQPTWIERRRETRQQVGLASSERQSNVEGAFYATPAVANQRLLLIDDVYTTGATLRACAAAALAAGAQAVYGLTLAQPPRRTSLPLPNDVPEDISWEHEET
jgi:ComF family protein